MNTFFGIGILAAIIYGLLVDGMYFKIYAVLLVAYVVIFQFIFLNRGDITKRKNLTIATWGRKKHIISYDFRT
jgi:hypothetical protein